jgi:hypothetical protein
MVELLMSSTTNDILAPFYKAALDCFAFIERLVIVTKDGTMRRLTLTSEQKQVIECLLRGENVVVLKARQLGITTVVRAFHFWKAYTAKNPIKCVVVSHKQESANEITLKDFTFYDKLPTVLRKPLKKRTSTGLKFMYSHASISSHTAGGHGGLRSFSVTDLHITELCFFEDPDELLATALAALNGGQVIIESTAKAYGDPMHRLVDKIQRKELQGSWKLLFFPWHEHHEYKAKELPDDFVRTEFEEKLAASYELNDLQIYWRRLKIQEIGISKFNTEYPACLDDVFAQKGDCYYTNEDLENVDVFTLPINVEEHYIEQPDPKDKYGIGVDVASGRGQDYSVITVLSKKTEQPVYIYRSNEITPPALALKIQTISTLYNDALTLIEENNWGLPVLNELRNLGFNNLWFDPEGKNWITTTKSKLLMHEDLKEAIRKGRLYKLDYITVSEIKALVLNDKGLAPEAVRGSTGHGDNIISTGLAWQCLQDVQEPLNAYQQFKRNTNQSNKRKANPFGPNISRKF